MHFFICFLCLVLRAHANVCRGNIFWTKQYFLQQEWAPYASNQDSDEIKVLKQINDDLLACREPAFVMCPSVSPDSLPDPSNFEADFQTAMQAKAQPYHYDVATKFGLVINPGDVTSANLHFKNVLGEAQDSLNYAGYFAFKEPFVQKEGLQQRYEGPPFDFGQSFADNDIVPLQHDAYWFAWAKFLRKASGYSASETDWNRFVANSFVAKNPVLCWSLLLSARLAKQQIAPSAIDVSNFKEQASTPVQMWKNKCVGKCTTAETKHQCGPSQEHCKAMCLTDKLCKGFFYSSDAKKGMYVVNNPPENDLANLAGDYDKYLERYVDDVQGRAFARTGTFPIAETIDQLYTYQLEVLSNTSAMRPEDCFAQMHPTCYVLNDTHWSPTKVENVSYARVYTRRGEHTPASCKNKCHLNHHCYAWTWKTQKCILTTGIGQLTTSSTKANENVMNKLGLDSSHPCNKTNHAFDIQRKACVDIREPLQMSWCNKYWVNLEANVDQSNLPQRPQDDTYLRIQELWRETGCTTKELPLDTMGRYMSIVKASTTNEQVQPVLNEMKEWCECGLKGTSDLCFIGTNTKRLVDDTTHMYTATPEFAKQSCLATECKLANAYFDRTRPTVQKSDPRNLKLCVGGFFEKKEVVRTAQDTNLDNSIHGFMPNLKMSRRPVSDLPGAYESEQCGNIGAATVHGNGELDRWAKWSYETLNTDKTRMPSSAIPDKVTLTPIGSSLCQVPVEEQLECTGENCCKDGSKTYQPLVPIQLPSFATKTFVTGKKPTNSFERGTEYASTTAGAVGANLNGDCLDGPCVHPVCQSQSQAVYTPEKCLGLTVEDFITLAKTINGGISDYNMHLSKQFVPETLARLVVDRPECSSRVKTQDYGWVSNIQTEQLKYMQSGIIVNVENVGRARIDDINTLFDVKSDSSIQTQNAQRSFAQLNPKNMDNKKLATTLGSLSDGSAIGTPLQQHSNFSQSVSTQPLASPSERHTSSMGLMCPIGIENYPWAQLTLKCPSSRPIRCSHLTMVEPAGGTCAVDRNHDFTGHTSRYQDWYAMQNMNTNLTYDCDVHEISDKCKGAQIYYYAQNTCKYNETHPLTRNKFWAGSYPAGYQFKLKTREHQAESFCTAKKQMPRFPQDTHNAYIDEKMKNHAPFNQAQFETCWNKHLSEQELMGYEYDYEWTTFSLTSPCGDIVQWVYDFVRKLFNRNSGEDFCAHQRRAGYSQPCLYLKDLIEFTQGCSPKNINFEWSFSGTAQRCRQVIPNYVATNTGNSVKQLTCGMPNQDLFNAPQINMYFKYNWKYDNDWWFQDWRDDEYWKYHGSSKDRYDHIEVNFLTHCTETADWLSLLLTDDTDVFNQEGNTYQGYIPSYQPKPWKWCSLVFFRLFGEIYDAYNNHESGTCVSWNNLFHGSFEETSKADTAQFVNKIMQNSPCNIFDVSCHTVEDAQKYDVCGKQVGEHKPLGGVPCGTMPHDTLEGGFCGIDDNQNMLSAQKAYEQCTKWPSGEERVCEQGFALVWVEGKPICQLAVAATQNVLYPHKNAKLNMTVNAAAYDTATYYHLSSCSFDQVSTSNGVCIPKDCGKRFNQRQCEQQDLQFSLDSAANSCQWTNAQCKSRLSDIRSDRNLWWPGFVYDDEAFAGVGPAYMEQFQKCTDTLNQCHGFSLCGKPEVQNASTCLNPDVIANQCCNGVGVDVKHTSSTIQCAASPTTVCAGGSSMFYDSNIAFMYGDTSCAVSDVQDASKSCHCCTADCKARITPIINQAGYQIETGQDSGYSATINELYLTFVDVNTKQAIDAQSCLGPEQRLSGARYDQFPSCACVAPSTYQIQTVPAQYFVHTAPLDLNFDENYCNELTNCVGYNENKILYAFNQIGIANSLQTVKEPFYVNKNAVRQSTCDPTQSCAYTQADNMIHTFVTQHDTAAVNSKYCRKSQINDVQMAQHWCVSSGLHCVGLVRHADYFCLVLNDDNMFETLPTNCAAPRTCGTLYTRYSEHMSPFAWDSAVQPTGKLSTPFEVLYLPSTAVAKCATDSTCNGVQWLANGTAVTWHGANADSVPESSVGFVAKIAIDDECPVEHPYATRNGTRCCNWANTACVTCATALCKDSLTVDRCPPHGVCVHGQSVLDPVNQQCGCICKPYFTGAQCDICTRSNTLDDCATCKPGYEPGEDDTCVCKVGYNIDSDCTACLPGIEGPDCDTETCSYSWDVSKSTTNTLNDIVVAYNDKHMLYDGLYAAGSKRVPHTMQNSFVVQDGRYFWMLPTQRIEVVGKNVCKLWNEAPLDCDSQGAAYMQDRRGLVHCKTDVVVAHINGSLGTQCETKVGGMAVKNYTCSDNCIAGTSCKKDGVQFCCANNMWRAGPCDLTPNVDYEPITHFTSGQWLYTIPLDSKQLTMDAIVTDNRTWGARCWTNRNNNWGVQAFNSDDRDYDNNAMLL